MRCGAALVGLILLAAPCAFALDGNAQQKSVVGRPHNCDKYYPRDLQRQGIEGTTTLAFQVTRQGWVEDIKIAQSSGNRLLDRWAEFCASHWHYKPATRDGSPVEVPWEAKVEWRVPDTAAAPQQP